MGRVDSDAWQQLNHAIGPLHGFEEDVRRKVLAQAVGDDMISKLLVGLDGSSLAESVLRYAAAIARAGNVPLVLLRVIPPDHTSELSRENPQLLGFMLVMPYVEPASTEDETLRHVRQDAQQYLDEVAEKLEQRGVVVETAAVRGGLPHQPCLAFTFRGTVDEDDHPSWPGERRDRGDRRRGDRCYCDGNARRTDGRAGAR